MSEQVEAPQADGENVLGVLETPDERTGIHEFIPGNDGFNMLASGYLQYSDEVNLRRAFPDVRDGLKLSQRRALFAVFRALGTKVEKSVAIVGEAIKYHPHGDSSIYQTVVGMTDLKGLALIPTFKGEGAFGHPFTSDPAASYRYTETSIHSNAVSIFFKNPEELREGVTWIPSEAKMNETEPVFLPARFPYVLCSESQGIGVSIRSNMPSFNPNEVLEMTRYYIENKSFDGKLLVPDFGTYGAVVADPKQIKKMMLGEKSKIVTRSTVDIVDGEIQVNDTPKDRSFQSIIREAQKKIDDKVDPTLDAVDNFVDASDKHGPKILIYPKRGKVDLAYRQVMASGLLSRSYTTSLYMVYEDEEGNPTMIHPGVYETIDIWYNSRVEVLRRTFTKRVSVIDTRLSRLSYLIDLSDDEESAREFIELLRSAKPQVYKEFLVNFFSERGIDEDMVDWLTKRRVVDFRKASNYREEYDSLAQERVDLVNMIENQQDIDSYILQDLYDLEDEIGQFDRRSQITNKVFVKPAEVKTESEGYFLLDPQGVLTFQGKKPTSKAGISFLASSKDILVILDSKGRMVRFRGDQLKSPINIKKERLALHGGAEALWIGIAPEQEDYKPVVFYEDGYYGTLNTSSWQGMKKLTNKVNTDRSRYDEALAIFLDEPDIDTCYLTFEQKEKSLLAGFVRASDLEDMPLGRRRKVFERSKNVGNVVAVSESQLVEIFDEDRLEEYNGVMRRFEGDYDLFVEAFS